MRTLDAVALGSQGFRARPHDAVYRGALAVRNSHQIYFTR